MRDIRKELIDILIAEVKPALGCTEPVAVALACAKAKELLGEEIVENRILVSPSIYKKWDVRRYSRNRKIRTKNSCCNGICRWTF